MADSKVVTADAGVTIDLLEVDNGEVHFLVRGHYDADAAHQEHVRARAGDTLIIETEQIVSLRKKPQIQRQRTADG